jgi:ATP-dependent Lon protease
MSPQDDAMQAVSAKTETAPEARPLPSDAMILVPVRDLVLFPEMVFPISVGRPSSVAAIQQAVREQRQILLVLQRDPAKEELAPADLHAVGTVVNILRYVTTPDGNHHIVCQGVQRFRITDFVEGYPFLLARGLHLAEPTTSGPEIEARVLVLKQQIRDTLDLLPQVPQELRQTVENTTSAGALADLAASYLDSKPNEKQEILEALDLVPRLDKVTQLLSKRLEVLRISSEIGKQTKSSLDARQREIVLREQMAAIQRELGEDDSGKQAIADLDKAITEAKMPPEAETAARKELRRLQRTPEASAEHGMIRTYLDTLIELPWSLPGTPPIDIAEARKVLDPIISAWRRSRSASSSISRCASSPPRARRRSCASSDLPASARPRSASRSPAPWAASSRV